jgi:hypothetical protein
LIRPEINMAAKKKRPTMIDSMIGILPPLWFLGLMFGAIAAFVGGRIVYEVAKQE